MLPRAHDFQPRHVRQEEPVLKRLLRDRRVLAVLAWILSRYVAFALRTTRFRLVGGEHFAPFEQGASVIAAFWHEHLPLSPALWNLVRRSAPETKMFVLVSRHNDGRFIGDAMAHFGVSFAYGSSAKAGQNKGGGAALRALLDVLRDGHQIAITPDGPRGPRRKAAPGVAQLAALSGKPVLPCAVRARPAKILRTWDRLILPLPFARGAIVCGAPIPVARDEIATALPRIEQALNNVAEEAEALCRD
jgi:lysophospholipid acyltransferase (LPLAT)-like uncharacterized protein